MSQQWISPSGTPFDPFLDTLRTCDRSSYDQVRTLISQLESLVHQHMYAPETADSNCPEFFLARETFRKVLSRPANDFLVGIVSRGPKAFKNTSEESAYEVLEKASEVIALLCGRAATGVIVREWELKKRGVKLSVREPGLAEGDIGFKTWGAARVMARFIDDETVPVRNRTVLELGSGTGLAGLAAAACGASKVYLTDYSPSCLESCRENAKVNSGSFPNGPNVVQVFGLDWTLVPSVSSTAVNGSEKEEGEGEEGEGEEEEEEEDILESTLRASRRRYDLILGSDLLYESSHPVLVSRVVGRLLSRGSVPAASFYICIPHRERYEVEVVQVDDELRKQGFSLRRRLIAEGREEETEMMYRMDEWGWKEEVEKDVGII